MQTAGPTPASDWGHGPLPPNPGCSLDKCATRSCEPCTPGCDGVSHPISCMQQIAPHGPIRTFFPHDNQPDNQPALRCPFSACPQQWLGNGGLQSQMAGQGLHHSHTVPRQRPSLQDPVSWGSSPHSGDRESQGYGLRTKDQWEDPSYKRQARHTQEEARSGPELGEGLCGGVRGERPDLGMSDLA